MCTRTLSTTISTSPSAMAGLSHGRRAQRPGPPAAADQQRHDKARDEAADVGEERDSTLAGARQPQRGDPVDQLEDEPEAEDEQGRHLDQLVEESEEHER